MEEKIRIQKFLSQNSICSRIEAEKLINEKKLFINGKVAELGQKVDENDEIKINGKVLSLTKNINHFYILFNKPKRLICTQKDPQNRKTIFQYLNLNQLCFSVGRLDYDTSGVIIITNDGEFTNFLSHPSNNFEREYVAELEKELDEKDLLFLNSDKVILNGKKSKQEVIALGNNKYKVKLFEGRNHHVKNLFLLVNNYVLNLHRTRYAIFSDKNLEIGKWRNITINELQVLNYKIKK